MSWSLFQSYHVKMLTRHKGILGNDKSQPNIPANFTYPFYGLLLFVHHTRCVLPVFFVNCNNDLPFFFFFFFFSSNQWLLLCITLKPMVPNLIVSGKETAQYHLPGRLFKQCWRGNYKEFKMVNWLEFQDWKSSSTNPCCCGECKHSTCSNVPKSMQSDVWMRYPWEERFPPKSTFSGFKFLSEWADKAIYEGNLIYYSTVQPIIIKVYSLTQDTLLHKLLIVCSYYGKHGTLWFMHYCFNGFCEEFLQKHPGYTNHPRSAVEIII